MKLSVQVVVKVEAMLHCTIIHATPIHGGDISAAWKLTTNSGLLFLKVNERVEGFRMFEAEAEGLSALRSAFTGFVPQVFGQGIEGSEAFLVMSWINSSIPLATYMENFGAALAALHRHTHVSFGWQRPNYIGTLGQQNTWCTAWPGFMASQRIMPLVRMLFDEGSFSKNDYAAAELLCTKLDQLVPAEPPALLHGDLWSGNYLITTTGEAAIFDPAVYYGHREMDLAMAKLFGGFSNSFFEGYHACWPLQPGWEKRVLLMQWYPLLVHAVLFGGHYVSSCRRVARFYA